MIKIIDRMIYDIKRMGESGTIIRYLFLAITVAGGLTKNIPVLVIALSTAIYLLFDNAINHDIRFLQWRNQKNYPGKKSSERKLLKWMKSKGKI